MAKILIKNKKVTENSQKAFTIVELIVVIAVFMFVIGAAITIFISIINSQRKVLADQETLSQISYVEEYMSKALRTAKIATASDPSCVPLGYSYLLTHRDLSTGFYGGIKFINQSGTTTTCEEFFLEKANAGDGNIFSAGATDTPVVLKEIKDGELKAVPITSADNLKINFVRFSINGADGSSGGMSCNDHLDECGACGDPSQCGPVGGARSQPRVTILLNVEIVGDSTGPARTIQTTVSQRNLNVQ